MDPFQGLDRVEYRLYHESRRMARSYRSFTRDVKRLFERRGGKYFAQVARGNRYNIPVLPTSGPKWFIVELYPPPDGEIEPKPLEVLVLFRNLYLLGFRGDNKWQFFSDATTEGLTQDEIDSYIEMLPFNGNYNSIRHDVSIDLFGQLDSYFTLVNFRQYTEGQVKKSLCRLVVALCEAIRFPQLMERITEAFEIGKSGQKLDNEVFSGDEYKNISSHFTMWDQYCSIIRQDEVAFEQMEQKDRPAGLSAYESVLSFVGVLLPLNRFVTKVMQVLAVWSTRVCLIRVRQRKDIKSADCQRKHKCFSRLLWRIRNQAACLGRLIQGMFARVSRQGCRELRQTYFAKRLPKRLSTNGGIHL